MAVRVDQRVPTAAALDAYNHVLLLSQQIMSIAKPKEPKPNNKHIPKRLVNFANKMVDCVIDIGADVIEANEIYVSPSLDRITRAKHYADRIALQYRAVRTTFRLEHIFRMLQYEVELSENTAAYTIRRILEVRRLILKWQASDKRRLNELTS